MNQCATCCAVYGTGGGLWHKFPTALENLGTNWTQPGQFYYDRAAASIGYIPREGESVAMLEATATTATAWDMISKALTNQVDMVLKNQNTCTKGLPTRIPPYGYPPPRITVAFHVLAGHG